MAEWTMTGRCWKFGDNVPNDGGIMDKSFLDKHLNYDPQSLAPYTFKRLRPEFGTSVKPGDIVVAGRRFAHGNPHIQGILGLKGAGVGVIVEQLQRTSYRLLVSAGVVFLPAAVGIGAMVEDGETLRVDFRSGRVENLSRGQTAQFSPLPDFLLEIIAAGGSEGHLIQRLAAAGVVPT